MSSKDLITDDTDILRYISNGKKASYDRSDYYAVGRLGGIIHGHGRTMLMPW